MHLWSAIIIPLVLLVHYASLERQEFRRPFGGRGQSWKHFKLANHKNYHNSTEERHRKANFKANVALIKSHNRKAARGQSSFVLGVNKYADLTIEEVRTKLNGYKMELGKPLVATTPKTTTTKRTTTTTTKTTTTKSTTSTTTKSTTATTTTTTTSTTTTTTTTTTATPIGANVVAAAVDWRTQGYVTPVKDQGNCGSCWAFSTTGALEGQHFKKTGQLVSLSEQNLVDCEKSPYGGYFGCNGGCMDYAFAFILSEKGIDTEASYPYIGKRGSCHFSTSNVGATLTGVVDIKSGSESALQAAVASVGPISIAIDASNDSFQLYESGIYYEPACSSTVLDHAMLVVGYGTENGLDYWIVKNTWGTTWGEGGYVRMSRNRGNNCGIATRASYPTV